MAFRVLAKGSSKYFGNGDIVREYQPCKRTIAGFGYNYEPQSDEEDQAGSEEPHFLIQFPYVIFFHYHRSLHVCFAKRPITSLASAVYHPTLGNVYEDFHICGADGPNIDGCIREFWQTEFSEDGELGNEALSDTFGTYTKWAKISKRGVGAITRRLKVGRMSFKRFLLTAYFCDEFDLDYLEPEDKKDIDVFLKRLKFTFDSKYPEPITLGQFKRSMQNKKNKVSRDLEKRRRRRSR